MLTRSVLLPAELERDPALIGSCEWLPGEQIPSVRQIAEEYSVSIGTARRSIAVLADEGLVVVTPSWGAFIFE